jgi:type II secretory pathway pseudopilin PulG
MTDAELWAALRFWLMVAAVVIVVAAALLVTIWLTARSIAAHARRALAAAEAIRDNTRAIRSCRRRTRSPKSCATRCVPSKPRPRRWWRPSRPRRRRRPTVLSA